MEKLMIPGISLVIILFKFLPILSNAEVLEKIHANSLSSVLSEADTTAKDQNDGIELRGNEFAFEFCKRLPILNSGTSVSFKGISKTDLTNIYFTLADEKNKGITKWEKCTFSGIVTGVLSDNSLFTALQTRALPETFPIIQMAQIPFALELGREYNLSFIPNMNEGKIFVEINNTLLQTFDVESEGKWIKSAFDDGAYLTISASSEGLNQETKIKITAIDGVPCGAGTYEIINEDKNENDEFSELQKPDINVTTGRAITPTTFGDNLDTALLSLIPTGFLLVLNKIKRHR